MSTIHKFKGWIPTSSGGGLSFSHFGSTTNPKPSLAANSTDDHTRYVISSQERPLSDQQFPFFKSLAGNILFGYEDKFRFVCIAKRTGGYVPTTKKMEGEIFIFHRNFLWKNGAKKLVGDCQDKLIDLDKNLEDEFQETYENLSKNLRKMSSFYLAFNLKRDGVAEIIFDEGYEKTVSLEALRVPFDVTEKNIFIETLSTQCFYFLRDIGHIHVHHCPADDNIVRLYEYDGLDDYNWRCKTLRGLLRKSLLYKISNKNRDCSNFLGILPYIKYFKKISEEETDEPLYPKTDLDLLEESIMRNEQSINSKQQIRIGTNEAILSYIVGFSGLFLSIVSLGEIAEIKIPVIEVSSGLKWIVTLMITETFQTFAIFIGSIFSLLIVFEIINPAEWEWVKTILRLIHSFRQNIVFILTLSASLFIYFIIFKRYLF